MIYNEIPVAKTVININDQSQVNMTEKTSVSTLPFFLQGFTSVKGTEDYFLANKDNWKLMYGDDLNYAKYGQPLLQAYSIVQNGGVVLCKRAVADDATLANLCITANIEVKSVQETDAEGNLLYIDASTGEKTNVASNNAPSMIDEITTYYTATSYENIKNINDLIDKFEAVYAENTDTKKYTFPLICITDIGRGESIKRVRIAPNYNSSKITGYMKYDIETIENSSKIETLSFTGNPDIIESKSNRALDVVVNANSNQIKAHLYEDYYALFISALSKITGISENTLKISDVLFGKTIKQADLGINVDITTEGHCNLSYSFGLTLNNGTNGVLGAAPIKSEKYDEEMARVFTGDDKIAGCDIIYDLDNYQLDLIVDAGYGTKTKRAIENLVGFRKDVLYLRDLGYEMNTLEAIEEAVSSEEMLKSPYCATYYLSYKIYHPTTKKPIKVTQTYEMALLAIDHFKEGRAKPFAGEQYGMVLTRVIKGTESYLPRVTAKIDDRETLNSLRVNYCRYYDSNLVVDTQITSQEAFTQLTNINNVLAIQQVGKAVRKRCPKSRYSYIDNDNDLRTFESIINAELNKYSQNFKKLKLKYLQDESMIERQVFYAAIGFVCKKFEQQEYFDLYVMNEDNFDEQFGDQADTTV